MSVITTAEIKQALENKITIRELKKIVADLHKQHGAFITKAKFGKVASVMNKAELVSALNEWVGYQECNYVRGLYHQERLSDRIVANMWTARTGSGESVTGRWTTNIGFAKEQDAFKFYQWLFETTGRCEWAAVRKAAKNAQHGLVWEVKVWSLSSGILKTLVAKDQPVPQAA